MGGDLQGRRLPPVLLGPGTPPAVGTVSTRQLVAFSRHLARAAEASSAVLPTLVPARTAVLTSGGRIRCGCGHCLRALRCGRCGHLPVLPGGPFSQHLPRNWAVLCSAPLQRVVRAHFLYFRRVFCRRSFPCLLSDPPAFYVGGGGGTQPGIPLQF